MRLVAAAPIVGVVATLGMDLLATAARKLSLTHGLAPPLVGRWFRSVLSGRPIVADIAQVPEGSREMLIGFAGHYCIGIALTTFYILATERLTLPREHPGVAFGYGALTNVFPWLLMFPAMGYGFFGMRAPAEWMLLRSSFVNHLCFGAGLLLAVRFVLPRLVR